MSMIASPSDGFALLGWKRVTSTALAFCLAPAVTGALILCVAWLFGTGILGDNALRVEGLAAFAMVSPLIGVPIWAAIALGTIGLLRVGSFGWLPAALLGVLTFGVLSRTGIGQISLPFGAVSALMYRMALALQRPDAI